MKSLEVNGSDLTPTALETLAGDGSLEHLTIWSGPFTNEDLAPLARLTALRELVLGEMRIDDGVFVHLRQLCKLEYLCLAYTAVCGDFALLQGLPLRDIRLEGCRRVGDAAVRSLAAFRTLRQLEIHMTGVTDAGVGELAGLPLEVLWLGPRVTDAAMHVLAGMPTLRHLDICAHNVSDEGAQALTRLPDLEVLWLSRCGITDVSVEALARLSNLRELNVNYTGVTEAGLRRLRTSLPNCRFPEPD